MRKDSVSPDALLAQITTGSPPLVLDVRSKAEFDAGHLPGAVHIPFWRVGSRWPELAGHREHEVVVYCGHGPRAYIAGAALRRHGFTRITYLKGHMTKWKQRRLPIVTGLLALIVGVSGLVRAQQPDVRMIAVEGEGAKYWPVWRGPSRQGLVDGSYPDAWSATENVLWKKAVPGRGNSSPVVWADRIFFTTSYEVGKRLSLLAFRRSDGTQLWEAFAPEGRSGWAHQKNGHA
jgi:rhodanese-related sulfurtransferase